MQIEPYLFFSGNCEEALQFYQRAIGARVVGDINRYSGTPMDNADLPAHWKDKVMHVTVECEGGRFMMSDAMPGSASTTYTGFSMSINVPKDREKAERIFNALAAGGIVTMPFSETFWGAWFGMVTDAFGVPWMVNSEK